MGYYTYLVNHSREEYFDLGKRTGEGGFACCPTDKLMEYLWQYAGHSNIVFHGDNMDDESDFLERYKELTPNLSEHWLG